MHYYVAEWSFRSQDGGQAPMELVLEADKKDYLWHNSNRDHFVKLHGPFDNREAAEDFIFWNQANA